MYKTFGKRLFDFISAAAGLIILSPLFLFLILLIYLITNRNPFFYQSRPGLDGEIFTIVKFKTMMDLYDKNGILLSDSQRSTSLGRFLRKTSLDELPQLWNVLIGEMSLVGPRPLLQEYLSIYTKEQSERHNVRPGMTGWAQVNGRNSISWEEKFAYDIWYVNNLSLRMDLIIVFLTLKMIFSKKPVNFNREATLQKFNG